MVAKYRHMEDWMDTHGSHLQAARMQEILDDIAEREQVTVAFCGLFSAGKSSLINVLAGENRLATGAVPTTAEVAQVTLSETGGRVVLLDTPGVDSTDDAHREATMNALHLADVMVLVADYQHVEAEENLDLLRAFTDDKKRMLLVVNQVDKHLDFELSFDDFQQHVEETLDDYGIVVECVFYTSTLESRYSELADLRDWLRHLQNVDEEDRLQMVRQRLDDVVRDAVKGQFEEETEQVLTDIEASYGMRPLDADEASVWLASQVDERDQIEKKLADAREAQEWELRTKREEWTRLVELAQIAPYDTTEKGRAYIESLRPEFKVGVIRATKKTEEERQRRAMAFVDDLMERTLHYLLVPLRNQLSSDIQEAPWGETDWVAQAQQIDVVIDVDYIAGQVKQGALVSNQYPYQYVKDVVGRIKRDVMAQLGSMMEQWFDMAKLQLSENHQDESHKLAHLEHSVACLRRFVKLHEEEQELVRALLNGEVGE